MRQYNNTMYKATLRFIVAQWVPYSAAMRLLTDWNNMPKSKTAVRRLLGMANQYRNHIFRYAKIVDPLCRLTEGEWPTRWDSESVPEECHTALEKLKTALTSPAVLSKPDPKLPFEVHVDASDTGIAGKLNQIEPSSDVQDESNITPTPKERLIACAKVQLERASG